MADEEESEKKLVMVAIDESECSRYALKWTLEYLKDTIANSEIILFTAQPTAAELRFDYASAPIELLNALEENHKEAGLHGLDVGAKMCAKIGITPRKVMEFGIPKHKICYAAEKFNVDLLVVGSQRTFLGSVSNYCVNHAKCPVLVVRMKKN